MINKLRWVLLFLMLSTTCAHAGQAQTPTPSREILKLEKVVNDNTIVASGQVVHFWGIKPIENDNPYSFAAKLYLETMLKNGQLSCEPHDKKVLDKNTRHCYIDQADIGSLMVQLGMASAGNHYYDVEEQSAKNNKLGMWHNPVSNSL